MQNETKLRNLKQDKATKIAIESVLKFIDVAFILFGGAIRGGKTFWGLKTLIFFCEMFPGSRWVVIRKDLSRIRENTIPSFEKMLDENIPGAGILKRNPYNYEHPNGSKILFRGENIDKDPELNKFKGFEANGFLLEELNELAAATLQKSFERAGSWIISKLGINNQPKPIVLGTTNPTQGWVKEQIYTPFIHKTLKPSWIYIPSYITDNPFLPQSYIDGLNELNEYEYRVFVLGDWDVVLQSGGEFLHEFKLNRHLFNLNIDINKTLHVSIDSNVLPYIAITLWQLEQTETGAWIVEQVAELPAGEPNNSAKMSGKYLVDFLEKIGYQNKVFLYGDPTTKAMNNIDINKKSFLKLFKSAIYEAGFLIEERFFSKAPNVSLTGDFINEILARELFNIQIKINETCKESINDYIKVKTDKDGGMHKQRIKNRTTGVSYEPHGHMTDTLRYFVCKVFEDEFKKYSKRFSDYEVLSENVSDTDSFLQGGF